MQKTMNTTATLLAGAAFSAAIILACGNGSTEADAATCDCPEAEPPLPGRIVIVERATQPNTSEFIDISANCRSDTDVDWTLLGGGCFVDDDNDEELVLYNSMPFDPYGVDHTDPVGAGYGCHWHNPNARTVDRAVARAVCLVPD